MRQVDHILVAAGMVIGSIGTIQVPEEAPGPFLLRQGCIQGKSSIVGLGGTHKILEEDQARPSIEPGKELFTSGQAVCFCQREVCGVLEIGLWVTVRTKNGMDLRGAFLREDHHVRKIEMPPELGDHIIWHPVGFRRSFI